LLAHLMILPLSAPPSPLYPPCVLPSPSLAITSNTIKGEGFRVHLHNGEHQRVVAGGSAGTKRRAAVILSDFGFESKTWCSLPFGEAEQRLLPPLLGGGRAKGQEGAGARASGPSGGDGVGHGGVWLGWETAEER
jgi:hypothetical protein